MKKVAVFVEGQSELIFVRNSLLMLIDNTKLSFVCLKLRASSMSEIPYKYSPPNPKVYFQIVDCGNDERVISVIKEREMVLISKGFAEIIGLRDMYCEAYNKRSPRVIDTTVIERLINSADRVISGMSDPGRVTLIFSIMELEAWFLSMYNLFQKIDPSLTVQYIEEQLGYDLRNVDAQSTFFKPSNEIRNILGLYGHRYTKSANDAEMITGRMDRCDFDNGIENGRCERLKCFYRKLLSYA